MGRDISLITFQIYLKQPSLLFINNSHKLRNKLRLKKWKKIHNHLFLPWIWTSSKHQNVKKWMILTTIWRNVLTFMKNTKIEEDCQTYIHQNYAASLPKKSNVLKEKIVFIVIQELKNSIIQISIKPSFVKAISHQLVYVIMENIVPSHTMNQRLVSIWLENSNLILTSIIFITRQSGVPLLILPIIGKTAFMRTIGKILDENHNFILILKRNVQNGIKPKL